eukprot:GCRY01003062.1.p1 GENE.GCRY01003062.1~~GCRY01003062.1.p1  ORF type:complete len:312 (+),score=80.81 GCRY01003062.1:240-1175(+)
MKNRRTFLKRCDYPISSKDLYLGAIITIYSRQLKIVEFGDDNTRLRLEKKHSSEVFLVKPSEFSQIGEIVQQLLSNGHTLTGIRSVTFSRTDLTTCLKESLYSEDPSSVLSTFSEKPICVISTRSSASGNLPQSVRNSSLVLSTNEANDAFFNHTRGRTTASLDNCSLCLVKPHAIGAVGDILTDLQREGFVLTAVQSFALTLSTATEFYEVYRGATPDYDDTISQLLTGMCVAVALTHRSAQNVVEALRQYAGHPDPDVAQRVAPESLRARYGREERGQNGVHITLLPEDGPLEVEYFFYLMNEDLANSN